MEENAILVEHLYKNYGDLQAIQDLNFKVKKGEFFAFLGENGAGKSTTISILCNSIQKTKGEVSILGHSVEKEPEWIKRHIGIVFQNSVLDKALSVKDNLYTRGAYYGDSKSEIKKRVQELVEDFHLEDFFTQAYGTLSGGQKRRVDIARALYSKPDILFLDEPTTGLDPMTRKLVWEIIFSLKEKNGMTLFLTTHYMEEVSEADYVVILDKGQIVANGTPDQLKQKYTYTKLCYYIPHDSLMKEKLIACFENVEEIPNGYQIKMENKETLETFLKNKDSSEIDFEITKGSMDEVFLNVTGRRLEK